MEENVERSFKLGGDFDGTDRLVNRTTDLLIMVLWLSGCLHQGGLPSPFVLPILLLYNIPSSL
jgi:hypothetical protein